MKINIAEILKDCPKGMKLYSPLLGNVTLEKVGISNTASIIVNDGFNTDGFFTKTGLYYDREDGECLLFPSSKMRDWTKFFKRGDVVCNKDGNRYAIFESWANDDYTRFNTTINYSNKPFVIFNNKEIYYTNNFVKASAEEKVIFITKAKKYYNYEYNPNTLQVEPIEPKCKFKPFDKVVGRTDSGYWRIDFFEFYNVDSKYAPYQCMIDAYKECLPYNNKTAKLISTCADYK